MINGDDAASQVRAYHLQAREMTTAELDRALGLSVQGAQTPEEHDADQRCHPDESVVNVTTPYEICRALFLELNPAPDDVIVDLGCGDGRVLLYGALTTPAKFVGVELIATRAQRTHAAAQTSGLTQVTVLNKNVLDYDLTHGTAFYAFRPFSETTEAEVMQRLHQEASRRPLTFAGYRLLPTSIDPDIFESTHLGPLVIHRSRH